MAKVLKLFIIFWGREIDFKIFKRDLRLFDISNLMACRLIIEVFVTRT